MSRANTAVTSRSPGKLTTLEAGRGVAALLVVAYHAAGATRGPAGEEPTRLLNFGYAGVDFFFVLSGFLIPYVHAGDFSRPRRVGRYLWKRITRIYPTYWVVLALVVPPLFFDPTLTRISQKRDPLYILQSALLLPHRGTLLLTVSWTLVYEMVFYVLVAVMILRVGAGVLLAVVWLCVIVAGMWVQFDFPASFFAMPRPAGFFLGMAIAWFVRRDGFCSLRPYAAAFAFSGTVGFLVTGVAYVLLGLDHAGEAWQLVFSFWAGMALLGLVAFEWNQGANMEWRVPKLLTLLGAASYSVYLIHYPVLLLMSKGARKTGLVRAVPINLLFAASILIAVLAGIALHFTVERPLLLALQRRGSRGPSRVR